MSCLWLDLIVQCFTSPPTQYRLYGRRFSQVKRPNQQYQSTEGGSCKGKQHKEQRKHKIHMHRHTKKQTNTAYKYNIASPLVYNNMGWLGDSSHRRQGCQAWTAFMWRRLSIPIKDMSCHKKKISTRHKMLLKLIPVCSLNNTVKSKKSGFLWQGVTLHINRKINNN